MATINQHWYITYADARGRLCSVWLQLVECPEFSHVNNLMTSIDSRFQELVAREQNRSFLVGELCIAKYSEDGKCYRARVVRLNATTAEGAPGIQVSFIDYGNTETVGIDSVIRAGLEIFAVPALATAYYLADFQPANRQTWTVAESEKLRLYLLDKEVIGEIQSPSRPGVPGTVRLYDAKTRQLVVDNQIRSGIGQKYDNAHLQLPQFKCVPLKVGCSYQIHMSHFESPFNFWVHIAEHRPHYEGFLTSLQQAQFIAMREQDISVSKMCIAKCDKPNGDKLMCRAVISNVFKDQGKCSLHLVDYGLSVDSFFCDIGVVAEQFMAAPEMAVNCTLTSPEAAISPVQGLLTMNNLFITSQTNGVYTVSKFPPGQGPPGLLVQSMVVPPPAAMANPVPPPVQPVQPMVPPPAVGISSLSPAVVAAPARVAENKMASGGALKLGEIYDIQVVNVEDSGLFFVHLAQNADKVEAVKQHLLKISLVPLPPPYISGINCIVKRSVDGLPCRAQIASVAGGSIHVYLIDFGSTENGTVGNIFRSTEELTQIPSFAVCCALAGNDDIPIHSLVKLLRKYEEKGGICARFVGKRDGPIYEVEVFDSICRVVTLIDDGPKEVEPVQNKRASIKTPQSPAAPAVSSAVAKPPAAQRQSSSGGLMTIGLDVGRKEKLFTTTVYSGSEFFGQLSCYSSNLLDDMQEELNAFYKEGRGRNLVHTNPGELCATTFSDDNFYRTRILKLDGKSAQVLFIDYGNIEDKPLQVLSQLDAKFSRLPIQGIRCRLVSSRVPKDELEKALLDKDITVMVEGRDGDTYEVSTPHCPENDSVNKLLQRYQGAGASNVGGGAELKYVTLESGKREKVAVTYVQDPEHVYMQPLATAIQLETLMTKINTHCMRKPVALTERPKLGTLVLALYPEDRRWYRGIIKGLKKTGEVEVQFVDFGNYSDVTVASVQAMQPDFLQLPAQALCCSLAGIQPSVAWSAEETDFLFGLLQDDAYFIVSAASAPRGDSWPVDITDHGGRSINQIFGQKTNKFARTRSTPSGDFGASRGNERSPRGAVENGGFGSNKQGGGGGGFQRNGDGPPRRGEGGPQGGKPEGGFGGRPQGKQEGGFQGRQEGGFQSRQEGGRQEGGFQGRQEGGRQEGGFQGRQEGGFQGRQEGSFQGRQEGGFQGRQEGSFQGRPEGGRQEGGFQGRQGGGFGNNERSGGFQRRDNAENGFSQQRGDGPPRRNEGGFQRRENEGGFQRRDNEGGFQKRDNEGGFQQRRNEGGFQKPDHEGGFQKRGGGREGGFGGNQGREDRGSGAGGFQRRDDNAGGGFGRQEGGSDQRGSGFGQGSSRPPRDAGNNQGGSFGGRPQRNGGRQTAAESWGDGPQSSGVTTASVKGVSLSAGQTVNVYAAFVVSPSVFWCQNVADSTPLDQFMATMRQELTNKPNDFAALTSPKVGDLCYSVFSEDDQWYRAKIVSVAGNSAEVLFIDYGNSESVSINQLKKLQPKHCELHAVAYKCQLSGVEPVEGGSEWSVDAIAKLEELIMEQELKCKLVAVRGETYEVELTNGEGTSVGEQLISSGLAKVAVKKPDPPRPQQQQTKPGRDTGGDMKVGQYCDVSVVYITSPQSFACQLVKYSKELSALMDSLRTAYSEEAGDSSASQTWEQGSQVCCKFSVDGEWYRGKVLEVAEGKVRVYFIDYGNDEWAELSAVRLLQAEFRALKPMAISCSLASIKPASGSDWSEEAVNVMEELTIDKQLVAQVVATDADGKVRVHLVDADRTSIGDELVKRKLALADGPAPAAVKPPAAQLRSHAATDARYTKQASDLTSVSVKTGVTYTMLSSWTNNVKDFYLQFSSEEAALATLAGNLTRRYATLGAGELALSSPAVGQACVAKFAADECWYRAVVVEVASANSVRVFYVDYGNTETEAPTDLKLLESQFALLPKQAVKCSLNLESSSPKITAAKLKAQLAKSPLTVSVVSTKGDTHVVDIVNNAGGKVAEILKAAASPPAVVKPVAKEYASVTVLRKKEYEVTVSHVDSSDAIYCQRNDASEQLDAVTAALKVEYETSQADASVPVLVGHPCAAKFADDGVWYRGRVVSEDGDNVTVQFVDYGNSAVVSRASVRALTAQLATPGPLATRCSLRGVPVTCTAESVKDAIDGVVSTESETPVKIVVHQTTPSVALVTMTVGDTDVTASVLTALSRDSTASLLELTVAAGAKLSEGDEVTVSSYNTVSDFWVQLKSNTENIEAFSEGLQAEYESREVVEAGDVVAGRFVCAKFAEDSKWYRAIIMAGADDGKCLVTFIDYGNSDNVPLADLRFLSADHVTAAAWAVQCSLAGVPEVEGSLQVLDSDSAKEALEGQEVKVEAASDDQPSAVTLNTASGANVFTLLKFVTVGGETKPDEKRVIQPLVPSEGERLAVLVSYVKTADVVCLQLADRAAALETLTEVIQAEAEELPVLQTCAQGDHCVAQFSEDRAWYRTVIEELTDDGETANVRFVDFGNCDTVAATELRQLNADLVEESAFAVECKLVLEEGISVADLSMDVIRTVLEGQEAIAEFTPSDVPHRYQVKLWQGETLLNSNIADLARPENKIVGYLSVSPVTIPASSKLDVTVSYVETPGQFWIQQASMADKLQELQDGMQSYATSHLAQPVAVNAVDVGTVCIGQSTEDDTWYRCQVTGVEEGTAQVAVKFVDFGNSEMLPADRLKLLPAKFSELPAQAVECSLSDVQPSGAGWRNETADNETYDLFSALVLSRTLEACVGECSETGVYNVQLLHGGVSVAGDLVKAGLALTPGDSNTGATSTTATEERRVSVEFPRLTVGDKVEVRVTSCVSPDNFWCQVVSDSSELSELVSQLAAYGDAAANLDTVTVGSLCVAKYSQDGLWYRAVVSDVAENEATVCFIDYGNTDVVAVDSLKVLSDALIQKPAMQAFRCRLAGVVKEESWDEGVCARLEELLVYDDEKTFTAQVVSVARHVSGPLCVYAILSLVDGQQSIAGALVEGGYAQAQPEVEAEVRDYVDDLISQAMANIDLGEGKSGGSEEQYSSELVRQAVQQASDVIRSAAAASRQLKEGATTQGYYVSPGTPHRFHLLLTTPSDTQPSVPVSDGTKISCTLAVAPRSWSADDVIVFEELCKDKLLTVDIVGVGADSTHVVSLRTSDSDQTISELLEQTSGATIEDGSAADAEASFLEVSFHRTCSLGDLPEPSQQLDESETLAYSRPKFCVGDQFDVTVLSAVNPDNVVIRAANRADDFDRLCAALKDKYSGDTSGLSEEPQKCQPCCVLVAEEQAWYRGEVVSVSTSDGKAVVNLVDRGVVKTLPTADLRVLYPAFLSLPALAVSCSLAHLQPTGITWNPELVEVMQVFCLPSAKVTPILSLTVIDFDEQDRPLIALSKNGVDLAGTLQHYNMDDEILDMADEHDRSLSHVRQEGLDDKDKPVKTLPPHLLIVNSVYDALMTHIISPSDIWCQVQSEQLEQLMEQLQVWSEETKAAGDVVPELAEGDACCARSSVNNVWYRAKVSVLDGSRYTVRFVDYGHEELLVLDNLLPLPAMFAQDPPFAVACSLHGIKPVGSDWPEDSTVTLEESVSVPFRMRVRRVTDDRVYVDLTTRDGDSLAEKLLAKSHSGILLDSQSTNAELVSAPSNDADTPVQAEESAGRQAEQGEGHAEKRESEKQDDKLAEDARDAPIEGEGHTKESDIPDGQASEAVECSEKVEEGEGRRVEGGDELAAPATPADAEKELTTDQPSGDVGGGGDISVAATGDSNVE